MVSIIIPIFNARDYLEKCIMSVLKQTYSDIEVILVDDGSIDGSESICDQFAQADNRVKVAHKNRGGQRSVCRPEYRVGYGDRRVCCFFGC